VPDTATESHTCGAGTGRIYEARTVHYLANVNKV
jgi:hypothetical protein